jgi:hypothetical protein
MLTGSSRTTDTVERESNQALAMASVAVSRTVKARAAVKRRSIMMGSWVVRAAGAAME